MSRRRRALLLPVLLVCTWGLLATSCGAEQVTADEYERELQAAMDDLEAAYGTTGSAVAPGADQAAASTEATVQELRSSQIALRDAANRLSEITPPAEFVDDHEALVAGVRDMADAVDLLVEAQQVAVREPARARELAREFASDESFGAVEAAASRLTAAGVDAGL